MVEELELKHAIDFVFGKGGGGMMTARENDPLLDTLFKCTVCIVYNQCAVSMLTCTTCDGENVTW